MHHPGPRDQMLLFVFLLMVSEFFAPKTELKERLGYWSSQVMLYFVVE